MSAFKLLFSISVLFVSFNCPAQENEKEESPGKLRRAARCAHRQGDIYTAIDLYEKYCSKTTDHEALNTLADLYRLSKDYRKAEKAYKEVIEASPSNSMALFYYARMIKMNGNCSLAVKKFEDFIKTGHSKKDDPRFKKLALTEIEGCKLLPAFAGKEQPVALEHLDSTINRGYTESSPVFINDSSFLFSSLRADTVIYRYEDDKRKIPVKKFHTAYKEKGSWKYYDYLHQVFNYGTLNTANGTYSPDGRRIYFNRCVKKRKNRYVCSIYVSELRNYKWEEPVAVEELNVQGYTSTQPTIGTDSTGKNEILFFASDRPGGKGGLDIWYSLYNPKVKTWSKPKNAGAVNSPGDDCTPYYDYLYKILYFSSDGWPGMGGLDIFKSEGGLKKWRTPVNMGLPYNSPEDDLYFVLNLTHSEGLLVSNRPTRYSIKSPTCCDDIYSFKERTETELLIAGKVTERNDSLRLPGPPLYLAKVTLTDTYENKVIASTETDEQGNFTFKIKGLRPNLRITAEKKSYFTNSEPLNVISLTDNLISLSRITDKAIIIKDIYYPFDESYLTEESKATIDNSIYKILVDNPSIIVELSSHTDSKGEDNYNLRLSQRRAESVVNYLISKGIDKKRVQAKGYGENRPIAPNETLQGEDNPIGREMNRRTEFRVIGTITNY